MLLHSYYYYAIGLIATIICYLVYMYMHWRGGRPPPSEISIQLLSRVGLLTVQTSFAISTSLSVCPSMLPLCRQRYDAHRYCGGSYRSIPDQSVSVR